MDRFVSSILPSMRRTSWLKLMSLARECFLRSASFSSSSTIGFSKSRGGSFTGESFDGHWVVFAEHGGELPHGVGGEAVAAARGLLHHGGDDSGRNLSEETVSGRGNDDP